MAPCAEKKQKHQIIIIFIRPVFVNLACLKTVFRLWEKILFFHDLYYKKRQ